jgi:enamine deaminase RidA (YjgF/YER057c/UK114 family)
MAPRDPDEVMAEGARRQEAIREALEAADKVLDAHTADPEERIDLDLLFAEVICDRVKSHIMGALMRRDFVRKA